jgi:hypothetical protein
MLTCPSLSSYGTQPNMTVLRNAVMTDMLTRSLVGPRICVLPRRPAAAAGSRASHQSKKKWKVVDAAIGRTEVRGTTITSSDFLWPPLPSPAVPAGRLCTALFPLFFFPTTPFFCWWPIGAIVLGGIELVQVPSSLEKRDLTMSPQLPKLKAPQAILGALECRKQPSVRRG